MNRELLCGWLELPGKDWPPDHYTLLGLGAGETDLRRIETQVEERMARLRGYQLSHPEEATEGMNRVAQAFITLSEAASQHAPASNGVKPPAGKRNGKAAPPQRRAVDDTAVLQKTMLDWRVAPPPVRSPAQGAASAPPAPASKSREAIPVARPAAPITMTASAAPDVASVPREQTIAPTVREVDEVEVFVRQFAVHSAEARAGLGTLTAVIARGDQTRLLLRAWNRLGALLRKKRLTTAEAGEFSRTLRSIRDVMDIYPAFLGHPGQPGYRVVALARLAMTVDMFRSMAASQRDDLLRDWEIGRQVLLAHRRFLLRQFKAMRGHGKVGLAVRAVRWFVYDHPVWFASGLLLLLILCLVVRFVL